MAFSRVASMHLVPLLARLALCVVFVPIGWNKIMTVQTYTGEQATAVRRLIDGPIEDPAKTPPPPEAGATTPTESSSTATKDDPAEAAPAEAAPAAATPDAATPAKATPEGATPDGAAAVSAAAPEPISARGVYGLAAMLQSKGIPRPLMSAWIASAVEVVGGVFLLIGLLSRIWALGLATAMGFAFALTTWPTLAEVGPFGLELAQFNRAAAQIGLGTLAIGVILSGPGAIAIDHGIFGSKRKGKDQESWDEDEEED